MPSPELDRAWTRAEQATQHARDQISQLWMPNGMLKFTAAEHTRRASEILAGLEQAFEEVRAVLATQRERARDRLAELEAGDHWGRLTVTELQRAAALRPFIEEDCVTLDVSTLAERIRAVAAAGDHTSLRLHLKYADLRLKKARSEAGPGATPAPIIQLAEIIRAADAQLVPDGHAARVAESQQLLRDCTTIEAQLPGRVTTLRSAATGTAPPTPARV